MDFHNLNLIFQFFVEYICVWESLYSSNFNYGEFAIIKSKSSLNNFKISVKEKAKKRRE